MCDVPYGVLLSGGLDSSVISAIAKKFAAHRIESGDTQDAWWPSLHSFAVGLKGAPDLAKAREVASACPYDVGNNVVIQSCSYTSNSVTLTVRFSAISKYNLSDSERTELYDKLNQVRSILRKNFGLPSNVRFSVLAVDKANRSL